MDARSFFIAVGPAIGAETMVNLTLQLLSPAETFSSLSDVPSSELLALSVSFLLFPMWAGARVARVTSKRRWFALGGVSVGLGTLFGDALSGLIDFSGIEASLYVFLMPIVLSSPIYAFLGFVGGILQRTLASRGA